MQTWLHWCMQKNSLTSYRLVPVAAVAFIVIALSMVFSKTFAYLLQNWQREEYSYGFLIPLISLYFIWQRRHLFVHRVSDGSWWGVAIVSVGLLLLLLDAAASVNSPNAYALVIVITGVAIATIGWRGFKLALAPIALLLLMVPLPVLWYNNLSSQLQLISSQLGTWLIRLFSIPVYLEGNVIELSGFKLEVAEACSGLRYLFPLVTLGAIIAYIYRGKAWVRFSLVLSTLPIAVLMNGLRIGATGMLVSNFGIEHAEGFLHEFEGWIIFMACFGLLLGELAILKRISGDDRSLIRALRWDGSPDRPVGRMPVRLASSHTTVASGPPTFAVGLLLTLAVYPVWAVAERPEIMPVHESFSSFPLQIEDWAGRRDRLDRVYLDTLKVDDYLLSNYVSTAGSSLNFYVAYYASQRSGRAEHSPSACLPGNGWQVERWQQYRVPAVQVGGEPLRVNRAVVQKGGERELVYYWFNERGRALTSEYLAKWYLLADSLTRNRSDGAMVRLMVRLKDGEDESVGDAQLSRFTASAVPVLERYLGD